MSLMLHFKLLFSFALLSMLVVFFGGHILLPALYMLFFWAYTTPSSVYAFFLAYT